MCFPEINYYFLCLDIYLRAHTHAHAYKGAINVYKFNRKMNLSDHICCRLLFTGKSLAGEYKLKQKSYIIL